MADPHVAAEVVAFSWRTRTDAALNPAFAPMLGHLMARYPESGKEFLSDLLEPAPPALSPGQVETVCRILIDMPDIGNWHQSALQILPRYGATAERLLIQDREGGDIEKQYRAQMWPAQLRGEVPGPVDQLSAARRRAAVRPLPDDNSGPSLHPLGSAASPRPAVGGDADPAANRPAPDAVGDALECTGGPVPQNAEYVFRNLPHQVEWGMIWISLASILRSASGTASRRAFRTDSSANGSKTVQMHSSPFSMPARKNGTRMSSKSRGVS